jgi:hypothetical protein
MAEAMTGVWLARDSRGEKPSPSWRLDWMVRSQAW